jgi:plastocyanin
MRARMAVCMGVVVIALAGCGDDEDGAAQATLDVVETDFEIDPKNATVDEAGAIQFEITNDGESTHQLSIRPQGEPGIPKTSDEMDPTQSTTFTAELDPGKYAWYCPVGNHRQMGMEGTLTVGGG